ncbi:NADH-quinone oxidoreductase subunit NuoK [Ekhidna sp.]|uniref:NADH-quinone oxidoreductase subunit NuoK n=1 Tax=Ekhidna sp. TaxID=2608089 RepID=UPI00329687EC
MSEEQLPYYLYFAALLFSSGVFVVLTKRASIFVLMGVELMLNGANIVLAVFSQYDPNLRGQVLAIFAIVLTVCEVSIALAILLNIYRKTKASNLDELTKVGN